VNYEEFAPAILERLRASRRIANAIVYRAVDSTQRIGHQLVEQSLEDDLEIASTAIVAWEQLEGRGRRGRTWQSMPGGGVQVSLTWGCAPEFLPLLPLASAIAVGEAIAEYAGSNVAGSIVAGPRLKWPNDVMMGDGKVAGVLIETKMRAGTADGSPDAAPCAVIVGFGVNLNEISPVARESGAVALADFTDDPPTLDRLTFEIAERVSRAVDGLSEKSRSTVVDRYRDLLVHEPGDELRCHLGSEIVEGRFVSVDDDGHLHLDVGAGERVLNAVDFVETLGDLDR